MNPDSVADEATRQALVDLQAQTQQQQATTEAQLADLRQIIEALAARVQALEA